MAKIKLGVIVTGIRGTVDGMVFSANKGGNYAKGWSRSTNPRTVRQASQRNLQSTWASNWRSLTAGQRTAWDTYAALPAQQLTNSLGIPYFISGFAWYVKLNTNIALAGGAPISNAPVLAVPAPPPIASFVFRITGLATTTRIAYTVDANIAMLKGINAYVVNSQGRIVAPRKKVFMLISGVNGFNQIPFQTETETRFGTIVMLQKMFAETYNQNAEGRRSSYVQLSANAQNV